MIQSTLNDCEDKFGDFGELVEAIQAYKSAISRAPSWVKMTAVQREAAELLATKLCRTIYGDPFDSWGCVWMSGPVEAVAQGQYTNGPSPWHLFTPDQGDVIVLKNIKGDIVLAETWDGKSYIGFVDGVLREHNR